MHIPKASLGVILIAMLLLPILSEIPPAFGHWGQNIEYSNDRWSWVYYDFTGNLADPGGNKIGSSAYTFSFTFSYNWGSGNVFGSGKADNVFVTISGRWNFAQTGTYAFTIDSDDGFKLYLDGTAILEDWNWRSSGNPKSTTRQVSAGYHNVLIYYFEATGDASLSFNSYLVGNTIKISFYSIDNQYIGQDPSTKPDLGAKLKATYKANGIQTSQEFNTPKTIDVDKNSYLTVEVRQNPSGWYFAERWDWYGHRQDSGPSLLITDVGTSDSKIAAGFLVETRVNVRIWGGDCHPGGGVQLDGVTQNDPKWWSPSGTKNFYVDGSSIGTILPGQYKDVQLTKGKHKFKAPYPSFAGTWTYYFIFWAKAGTNEKIGTDLGNGEVEIDVQSDVGISPHYTPGVTGTLGTVYDPDGSGPAQPHLRLNEQNNPFWMDWPSPSITAVLKVWDYPNAPPSVTASISFSIPYDSALDSASEFSPWKSKSETLSPGSNPRQYNIQIKLKATSGYPPTFGSPDQFLVRATFTASGFTQSKEPVGWRRSRVMEVVFDGGEPIKYTPNQPLTVSGYYGEKQGPEVGKGAPNAPVNLQPDWTSSQIVITDSNGHFSAQFSAPESGTHSLRAIAHTTLQTYAYSWKYERVDRTVSVEPPQQLTHEIKVYSLDKQYIGQDPEGKPNLGGSIRIRYRSNGIDKDETKSTPFSVWADEGTSFTVYYAVDPGGYVRYNYWDDYGIGGQRSGSSAAYSVGTSNHKVVAFFEKTKRRIDVYAIDEQYRGQDPATKTDLHAKITITYTRDWQSRSETYTTHFYVMADENTQVTLQVYENPSGWSHSGWWDDYAQGGQRQGSTVTYGVGTTDHKIAAFFIQTPTFDFSISAQPSSLTIKPKASGSSTINVVLVSGTTQSVTLSYSWLDTPPSGTQVSLNPSSGNPTFSSMLTVTLSDKVTPGNSYRLKVVGTGGGKSHDTTVMITVGNPDTYTLSVSSSPEISVDVTVSGQQPKTTPCQFSLSPGTYTVQVPETVERNGIVYTFDYWLGDASGDDPQTSIDMNSDKGITAVYTSPSGTLTIRLKDQKGADIEYQGASFEVTYGLRVETVETDNGIATVRNIPAGTSIQVKALSLTIYPSSGVQNAFADWSGISGEKNGNIFNFTFASDCTLEAIYNTQYSLTIATQGLSESNPTKVYLGGSDVGTAHDSAPLVLWFDESSQTGTIGVDEKVGEISFKKWLDGPTENPRSSMVINSPITLVAVYLDFDFSLIAYPPIKVISPGETAAYTIAGDLIIGEPKQVSLSASGIPSGASSQLNPQSPSLPFLSSLIITTSESTSTGVYTITIEGVSAGQARQASVTLVITNDPDFYLFLDKHIIPFTTAGGTSAATISVKSVNGFNDSVTLSYEWTSIPSGITVSIDPTQVTPEADGVATSTLAIVADSTVVPGTYVLRINGTSGSLRRYDELRVIVSTNELHVLHVNTSPFDSVIIKISGDYNGYGATPFDVGPSATQFSVSLEAPSVVQHKGFSYNFLKWYVDNVEFTSNPVSINVGSEHSALAEFTGEEKVLVNILQPSDGETVGGLMYVKAFITNNKFGPGVIANASLKLENSTWSSGWIEMQRLDIEGNWHGTYDLIDLANGAYTLTVNGTSVVEGRVTSGEDSIGINVNNSGIERKKTFYLNVRENKRYEEDRFLPGETMIAKFSLNPAWAGQQVIITISGGDSLIYPSLLSQYPSSQVKVIPSSGVVEATFPFDFPKSSIYGDYQVRVLNASNPSQQLDFANFHIMDGEARWVVSHSLGEAHVIANLYWAGTNEPIIRRTGTLQASALFPPDGKQLIGVIDANGGISTRVPYYDWKGELKFVITYVASTIKVLQNSEHTFPYNSLAASYKVVAADYKATVSMEFYIKEGNTPVDAWAYLQASPTQQWISAKSSSGMVRHELNVVGKPKIMILASWCYAMVSDRILASQYSNVQLSREEIKAVPYIDEAKIEGGYLTLKVSTASSTMWMDMNNVEAVVQIYSLQDKLIKTQTFALSIKHGEVNYHTLQITGVGAGAYKISVVLYYAGQIIGQTARTMTVS